MAKKSIFEERKAQMESWRRGAKLAFSMLHELEDNSFDETAYDGTFRDGRPQKNIVAAYLAKLKELIDPHSELAFAAILTDHIASGMHAGVPCIKNCEKHYAYPIPTEPVVQEVQS